MIGWRGILAGLLASVIVLVLGFTVLTVASRIDYGLFAIDVLIVVLVGTILGFVYGVIDKFLFFLKPGLKLQVFILVVAVVLATSGRGAVLVGQEFYNYILGYIGIPLLGDFMASLFAAILWSIVMAGIYLPLSKFGKKKEQLSIPGISVSPEFSTKKGFSLLDRLLGKTKMPQQASVPPPPLTTTQQPVQFTPTTLSQGYIRCPYCGTINEPGSRFCKNCGRPLFQV